KPDILFLHVFGALCYPKNDCEDIRKLGAKGDIGFFIGCSAEESTSNSSAVGSDDGVTTSFQRSHNSRPPMLDHQDNYMMKAQGEIVSKAVKISSMRVATQESQGGMRFKDNDLKIKIQVHRHANNESKKFPRTRL
nr:integrase, catalytic region, zinc finger, CCHC-type, peptidase aspartic, catalytic [Tanacetum cinerariifolium]